MKLYRRVKGVIALLVPFGAAGLVVVSLQGRAADPVPPPPPMPDASTQAPSRPDPSQTKAKGVCVNCGEIRSIRQIERERATGRQIAGIGPFIEGTLVRVPRKDCHHVAHRLTFKVKGKFAVIK